MADLTETGKVNMDVSEVPKLLYQKALNYCKLGEDNREIGKAAFINNLHNYIENLIQIKNYDEIFKCFDEAQSLYEEDSDVLNVLGVTLNSLEKPLEAIKYLDKAINNSPTRIKILENRENIINQWVPRWHFSMLNDQNRNQCYKNAITTKIQDGYKTVLDIGTGTGLLSIYAHEAGAEKIIACEIDEIMSEIAKEVFEENQLPIKLLTEHSTNINLENIEVEGFDLIVTEIFDCGAFGEGVLATLYHAKENLLKENGKILPESVKMFVAGVNKINVSEKYEALESTLENSIYLKDTILTPKNDGPYEPIEQICTTMILVTEPVEGFMVDFNNLNNLKDAIGGKLDKEIKLSCMDDGFLEGFVVYFELKLDDKNILKNFDPFDADRKSIKCWDPVIFPLNHPMAIRKYQVLNVTLNCKEGILQLNHDYDNTEIRNLKLDPEVFSILTDDDYMYELEYNVGKVFKKDRIKIDQLGDFLPFPHIGINLLKENKISKLYCIAEIKDLVKTIAEWNCIPQTSIEFVDDFDNLATSGIKFDFILIHPLTNHGTLNETHLKYYEILKTNCLSQNGTMFPYKVDLCCKLIHSVWLDRVSKVRNDELARYGIEKRINKYSTKHQFEFLNFDSCDLSDVITLSTIQYNDKLYTKETVVNLNSSQSIVNGILYFYKIFFMNNSIPILTNRKKSFCKLNCFVQTVNVDGRSTLIVNFVQDEFAFRCEIKDK